MPKKRDNCGEEGFTAAAGAASHRAVRGVVALAYRTPIPPRRGQRRGPDTSPLVTAALRVFLLGCLITQGDATGHLLQHGAQSGMVPAIAAKATATAQTVRTVPAGLIPCQV